ncbi:hypothetical protein [Streptomyces sp. B1I3]|uniref:hypothetical protein n=1 Tax=Streptomyces sp. B1I3 TaxID=3042264 RepID=UPI00277D1AC5|nr:hypothetical protein [Streptomyces sp. B1I3]MDQ0794241.1 hypothetical protein [Streptomyces sp. B1I3]
MDTMSVNVSPLHSATSVAGARESTRGFLDGLIDTPSWLAMGVCRSVETSGVHREIRRA